jgi:bacillolysin
MYRSLHTILSLLLLWASLSPLSAAGRGGVAAIPSVIDVSEFGALGAITAPHGRLSRIVADAAATSDTWNENAVTFARGYVAGRGGSSSESFDVRRTSTDSLGQVHIRMTQSIAGLPVVGAELIVHADAKTGNVIGVNGRFASGRNLPRQAKVGAGAAVDHAAGEYGIDANLVIGVPELTYIIDANESVRLAWTNLVSYIDEDGDQVDRIYADALTGESIARHPQIRHIKSRSVYTCNNTITLPGTLMFVEGGSGSTTDPVALNVYANAGLAYDYWWQKHGRDSYNNAGAIIKSNIHYGSSSGQAAWTSSGMIFGDGGSAGFNQPLGNALDVVGHELTHGVVASTAGLPYVNEPGALDESFADCFGAATEAKVDGLNDNVWKIAEDVRSSPLRSLKTPFTYGGTDYYPNRYVGSNDNGGVHTNSGVQNLAFYLLAQGGSHPRSITTTSVTGIGLSAAEQIFYRALDVYTTTTTTYRTIRDHTRQAAADLYGTGSSQHTSMTNAWIAVGNDWNDYADTISTAGNSWTVAHTTGYSGYHTAYLAGPWASDYDLYLERWNGSAWIVMAEGTSPRQNESIEYSAALAGQYRWRVHAYGGTGAFTLKTNQTK